MTSRPPLITALSKGLTRSLPVSLGNGSSFSPSIIPSGVADLSLWYDADDAATITHVAGAVSQWNDKALVGPYHATQGTGASQPITGTRTINGRNALDFDGTDDNLISNNAALNYGASTVICIFLPDTVTTSQMILANNGGGGTRYNMQNQRIDFGNNALLAASTSSGSVLVQIGRVDAAGGSAVQYLKMGSLAEVNNGPARTGLSAGLRVGATGGGLAFFNGAIGEICNYRRMLTNAEINSLMNGYFVPKWGVPWVDL